MAFYLPALVAFFMRLVYLTNVSVPAGDAQSIQVRAMSRAFFSLLPDDFLFISPRNYANRELPSEYRWKKISHPFGAWRMLRYLWVAICALPTVIKFKADCLYSRDIGIVWLYRRLGYRAVYEMHKPFETRFGHWIFKHIVAKIKIVAISDALKRYVVAKYNVPSENVLVAHDGVALQDFAAVSAADRARRKMDLFKASAARPVILYAGSLQIGKGAEILPALARRLGDSVLVAVLGGDGAPTGSPVNLVYLGRQPPTEVAGYLQAADLLILPTLPSLYYAEYSSPLKLFEYMASGTPIAASRLGAITEVLTNENAWLFTPGDINECAGIIAQALSNPTKANQKAAQAQKDVAQYAWGNRAARIVSFLKSV